MMVAIGIPISSKDKIHAVYVFEEKLVFLIFSGTLQKLYIPLYDCIDSKFHHYMYIFTHKSNLLKYACFLCEI